MLFSEILGIVVVLVLFTGPFVLLHFILKRLDRKISFLDDKRHKLGWWGWFVNGTFILFYLFSVWLIIKHEPVSVLTAILNFPFAARVRIVKPPTRSRTTRSPSQSAQILELSRIFEHNNRLTVPDKKPTVSRPTVSRYVSPHLQQKLINLLRGDRAKANRLVDSLRAKYPDQLEDWLWEKAIRDLERDRR